jgi:oxygen-dependent protoporphyrinogen oxidase
MVDMFAGPLMAGIYAGDPYTLSMRSTFPQLIALEREHGGLIRGVRAMMAARGSLQKRGTPHSPFLSLRGGMGTLIETLRAKLTRTTVRLNTSVTAVSSDERHLRANASRTHAGKQFRVTLADGSALEADAVIVCTPPRVTAGLIAGLDKTASIWMESIESATTASVFLAWSREHVRALPAASGLLVPRSASRAMSAATLINNKWPGRAPDDQVFLRVFFGGVRDPLVDSLDDAQLVRLAVKEVGPLLGVAPDAPLRFHRVYRWVACNPQPDLGHADNMAQVAYFMDKIGPIAISAGGVRGIGIPDCVNHAQQAARSVITALNARTRSSSPRPTA